MASLYEQLQEAMQKQASANAEVCLLKMKIAEQMQELGLNSVQSKGISISLRPVKVKAKSSPEAEAIREALSAERSELEDVNASELYELRKQAFMIRNKAEAEAKKVEEQIEEKLSSWVTKELEEKLKQAEQEVAVQQTTKLEVKLDTSELTEEQKRAIVEAKATARKEVGVALPKGVCELAASSPNFEETLAYLLKGHINYWKARL